MSGKFVVRVPVLLLFAWFCAYLPGCDSEPAGQLITKAEHEMITLEFVNASENDAVFRLANHSSAPVSFELPLRLTSRRFLCTTQFSVSTQILTSGPHLVPHLLTESQVRRCELLRTSPCSFRSMCATSLAKHKGQPCRLHLTLMSAAAVVSKSFTANSAFAPSDVYNYWASPGFLDIENRCIDCLRDLYSAWGFLARLKRLSPTTSDDAKITSIVLVASPHPLAARAVPLPLIRATLPTRANRAFTRGVTHEHETTHVAARGAARADRHATRGACRGAGNPDHHIFGRSSARLRRRPGGAGSR